MKEKSKSEIENPELEEIRKKVKKYIEDNHGTAEEYCWVNYKKGIKKATISNLLNDKKDFRISTLRRIARSMGLRLEIKFK